MKVNKILPEYSINKIWDKFSKMNGAVIEFLPENWVERSDGIFSNTVSYRGFSEDMTAEIDLYDDGNLTDTQISEYNDAITDFYINDDSVVAYASSKPTQSIKIILRGEFALESINDLISDNYDAFDPDKSYKKDECIIHDNIVYRFTADKDPGEWDPYIVESTSILREVSRCFQSVSDGKALIASAITDQGIDTPQDATFNIMSDNIKSIVNAEWYRTSVINALPTNFGLSESSKWEDIIIKLNSMYPETWDILANLANSNWTSAVEKDSDTTVHSGSSSFTYNQGASLDLYAWAKVSGYYSRYAKSSSFDITGYRSLVASYTSSTKISGCCFYLQTESGNVSIVNGTTDISKYTGKANIYMRVVCGYSGSTLHSGRYTVNSLVLRQ